MSIAARRNDLPDPARVESSHPGLLLDRYLEGWSYGSTDNQAGGKESLLDEAVRAVGRVGPLYTQAFNRWRSSLPRGSKSDTFVVRSRLIVGLGGHHVLETGLTLHRTYGTPMIPGSSLKGLASHYCHRIWGDPGRPESDTFRGAPGTEGDAYRVLFGTPDEGSLICFHDAWMDPGSLGEGLRRDVMTPHHGDSHPGTSSERRPTDFDDPVPVPFLSVRGSFLVAVSAPEGTARGEAWAALALTLLGRPLDAWGVGGKTSSGYGRMSPRDAR